MTWAAILGGAAQLAFLHNFVWSAIFNKKANRNPWKANTLEWTTPVDVPHGNWPGEIPTVYRWPYDYSKPGHDEDYIPQHIPYSKTLTSNIIADFAMMPPEFRLEGQAKEEQ